MNASELEVLRAKLYRIALGLAVAETAGRKAGTKTVKACPRCGGTLRNRIGDTVIEGWILHTPKCEIGLAGRDVHELLEALRPPSVTK